MEELRMNLSTARSGRPRRYDIRPVSRERVANREAAYAVALLDELSERLFDLISDLPQEALDFVPEGTTNSIAMLVLHMASAEAGWIARSTRASIAPELEQLLRAGRQGGSGDLPPSSSSPEQLIELCRRVRQEVTDPALSSLPDIDFEIPGERGAMTLRQVLMHLIWHWTYHSGQVGSLRRLWGSRYKWTFAAR
jgi:uncharacterized damage-inducible protein DinB